MNRVKMTQVITDQKEEHITMQDFTSTVSFSPSFSFYASSDVKLVDAAVRAVRETDSYYSVKVDGNDDVDFEFETLPLHEESFFHFPTTSLTSKCSSADNDVATDRVRSKDLFYGGWNIDPPSLSSPSKSHASSESEDFENLSPSRYYCFWSPIRSPARGDNSKSKGSSSVRRRSCRLKEFLRRSHSDGAVPSSSTSKRCLLKNLLRRSHSDGAVPSSSTSKRCLLKNLLRRSHSDGGGDDIRISNSPSVKGSPAVKVRSKTGSYSPEVIKRRKSYLPYKQDLIGVFSGMSRFRH